MPVLGVLPGTRLPDACPRPPEAWSASLGPHPPVGPCPGCSLGGRGRGAVPRRLHPPLKVQRPSQHSPLSGKWGQVGGCTAPPLPEAQFTLFRGPSQRAVCFLREPDSLPPSQMGRMREGDIKAQPASSRAEIRTPASGSRTHALTHSTAQPSKLRVTLSPPLPARVPPSPHPMQTPRGQD